jgi:Cof subfamily protein (haloacid dehalogenase superfamily)
METTRTRSDAGISAVLADVDGTLVTKDKVLTDRALRAVEDLREHGIAFTLTSGRPPFGMRMLVEPLGLTMPMAAFNGGVLMLPDMTVLEERLLPSQLLSPIIELMQQHGLDVWLFRTKDWCVRAPTASRAAHEASVIQQAPVIVPRFDDVLSGVVKIVGVSEDHERVAACEAAMQATFPAQVSAARSQPYYLDVTHPEANKGVVIQRLSKYLGIPLDRIVAIGDQANDILMFNHSGVSIAMGNASDEVKRQATFVTSSSGDEGFANAVAQIILPRASPAAARIRRAPAIGSVGRAARR